jgi:hypothetical protein
VSDPAAQFRLKDADVARLRRAYEHYVLVPYVTLFSSRLWRQEMHETIIAVLPGLLDYFEALESGAQDVEYEMVRHERCLQQEIDRLRARVAELEAAQIVGP